MIKAITLDNVKIYNTTTPDRVEIARMAKGVTFFASEMVSNFLHVGNGFAPIGNRGQYINVLDWNYIETPPPPPPSVTGLQRVCIVKQRPVSDTGWIIRPDGTPAATVVNYTQLSDRPDPRTTIKGATIPVLDIVLNKMRAIQSESAFNWMMKPHNWWINKDYPETGVRDRVCECITAAGNYLHIIGENATHYQIQFQRHDDNPVGTWETHPHLWHKASAHNQQYQMFRVGNGLDGFAPLIGKTAKLWIAKIHAEEFRRCPFTITHEGQAVTVTSYELEGCSVYGVHEGGRVPLLLRRHEGENVFHPEWNFNSLTVIPTKI
jgi:hypothetical protein